MNKKIVTLTTALILGTLLLISSCEKNKETAIESIMEDISVNGDYIAQLTGGKISIMDSLFVAFQEEVFTDVPLGEEVNGAVFSIKPRVKGIVIRSSENVLEFIPNEPLEYDTEYIAQWDLSRLFDDVPEEDKILIQGVRTEALDFSVNITGSSASMDNPADFFDINGMVQTSDFVLETKIEKLIFAEGENSGIEWSHDGNRHSFIVRDVPRKNESYDMVLRWDGKAIKTDKSGKEEISIPARGEFNFVRREINTSQAQVKLEFSMPLDANQDLSGLVTLKGHPDPRVMVDRNILTVYLEKNFTGSTLLTINKALRDISGSTLSEDTSFSVSVQIPKPQVKTEMTGGILPTASGAFFSFSAVSLKAVDVTVIRIFPNNMVQFLQENSTIKGDKSIKRVGRPVARKTIQLDESDSLNLLQWNTFRLDLSEITEMEPGAVYRVIVNFRRMHSLYCSDQNITEWDDPLPEEDWDSVPEYSYWDSYSSWFYYGEGAWENRDNPCSPAYYGDKRAVSANILASNIAVIAKRGDSGKVTAHVLDLLTTKPLENAEVTLYDLQGQILNRGKTDTDGKILLGYSHQPFMLAAEAGGQYGYLKMDNKSALSLSNFDIGGTSPEKGVKGYIFAERGVWRPGDKIFLRFILEDKRNSLPADHPVVMELLDTRGQLKERIVQRSSVGGIYDFETSTPEGSETGNWTARVRVGDSYFSKTLKIETVKPNRMRVRLEFSKDQLTASQEAVQGTMKVSWLHGAPARNVRVATDWMLTPIKTRFKGYSGVTFDDPLKTYYGKPYEIFQGEMDENGEGSIYFKLPQKLKTPGMVQARFLTKAFEGGGDFSIDQKIINFHPYSEYVGLKLPEGDSKGMLLTDKDHSVRIVTVDNEGNPVSRSNLKIELRKIEWRWWWDKSQENMSRYLEKSNSRLVSQGTVNTSNGEGTWTFQVKYPSWGRYLVRVIDPASGHSASQVLYMDWPGWAGQGKKGDEMGAGVLSLFTGKSSYKVGETVNFAIPTDTGGRALISIEKSGEVLDSWFVETKEEKTTASFKVTPEMAPNIYLHVTLVQPFNKENDRPIRLYGIEPLDIENPQSVLNPVISSSNEFKPEKEAKITVSEATGKPMSYVVYVVDEGLLDLTRYQTPNPRNSFYTKEALQVQTWDIYDDLLTGGATAFDRMLAMGGSDGEMAEPKKARRFKPVVFSMGPFTLKAGEKAEHNFTMPLYIGAVRVMVVAVDADKGAYGSVEKSVKVKTPLMALGTLPRALKPGEKIALPVNLFVLENHVRKVDISVTASGALSVSGEKKQSLTFEDTGDTYVFFDLEAAQTMGSGKVRVTAKSGKETSTWEAELNIEAPNAPVTVFEDKVLSKGDKWEIELKAEGLQGTNNHRLEVSTLPPLSLERRIKYLISYPYGCIEQTTSSAFPQLYLDELSDLTEEQQSRIQHNVNSAIARLENFLVSDGGLSYWPGGYTANSWGTVYAAHFLTEADRQGFYVPSRLSQPVMQALKKSANRWRAEKGEPDLTQAYRLYVLALAGQTQNGAMNRLRGQSSLSSNAAWRLAAAYALAGQEKAARQLIAGRSVTIPQNDNYNWWTYGSSLRDQAMVLETLVILQENEKAFGILKTISQTLSSGKWLSTQTTAFCLLAAGRYAGEIGGDDILSFDWEWNGKKGSVSTQKQIQTIELPGEKGSLKIDNSSKGILYVQTVSDGIPQAGKEKAFENKIGISWILQDKSRQPVSGDSFEQGTDLMLFVEITNKTDSEIHDLALSTLFPSGWEIINYRAMDIPEFRKSNRGDYQDIRDTSIYTFFDLKPKESKEFAFYVNTAYQGTYWFPGFRCEAMYQGDIACGTEGFFTTVKPMGR